MKNFLSLLLVLFLTTTIAAQQGYREGYIINTANDTVYGYIENNNYFENSVNCNFRKSISDPVVHYSPDQLYGFRFNDGKFYISKEYENRRYFFEYLVNGKLKVYSKQDKDLTNRYYIEKDTLSFRELEYQAKIIVGPDGIQRLAKSQTHNLLLSYYTSDLPEMKEAAMSIDKPGRESLIRFAREYNAAMSDGKPPIEYEKKSKALIEIGINGGVSYIFEDSKYYIPHKAFATGALMFNVMVPQISESIYFGLGLGYFQYPERIFLEKNFLYTTFFGDSIFQWVYETRYDPRIQIPFSVYYNNHRPGLSPIFGLSTNILYLFDFKVLCGVNFQRDLLAIKLYGEYSMFPGVNNSYLKAAGIKIGVSYLIK